MNSNRKTRIARSLTLAIASAFFAEVAGTASITLNDGGTTQLNVGVRDTSLGMGNHGHTLSPTSLPFTDADIITSGLAVSSAQYSLGQGGFQITTSTSRPGTLDSTAGTSDFIFFSVSGDTSYSLGGFLSVHDPGSTGRSVGLQATLTDVDTSEVLFNSYQISYFDPNISFQLGGTAGNQHNELSGSETGLLLDGHRYSVLFYTSIYANDAGDPASAAGGFGLTLTSQSRVPESGGSLGLLSLGLVAVGGLKRKIRRQ